MDKAFIEAINANDIKLVRLQLANQLLVDPRGDTFSEMLKYAIEKCDNLFEENKPSNYDISPDKGTWTKEILFKAKSDLRDNFSEEKLALLSEIAMHVGKEKAERINKEEIQEEEISRKKQEIENKGYKDSTLYKNKGRIVTASGAILVITGLCIGKTIITFVGGTLAVGGIILTKFIDNKE